MEAQSVVDRVTVETLRHLGHEGCSSSSTGCSGWRGRRAAGGAVARAPAAAQGGPEEIVLYGIVRTRSSYTKLFDIGPIHEDDDHGPMTPSWALVVLLATQLMVILDGTIVNVALPTIRTDLGFTDTGLAWVVNGFFVAFAVLLLPAGRLGDLVGTRKVFVAGLALVHRRDRPLRPRLEPGQPGGRPGRPGCRRRAHLGGRARHDRRAVRRPGGSRAGLRAGRVRRFGRRVHRRRRRRPAHRAGVLAVGVPGQRPAGCRGPARRVRRPGRDGRTPRGCAAGWPRAGPGAPLPAHPPGVPAAERGAVHDDGGRVLLPVPHRALPPGHPRPRRAAHRPGLPARDDRDRRWPRWA